MHLPSLVAPSLSGQSGQSDSSRCNTISSCAMPHKANSIQERVQDPDFSDSPTLAWHEVIPPCTKYGKSAPSGLTYIISTWFEHHPLWSVQLSAADPDGALGARVARPWIFGSPLARASLGYHSSSPARLVRMSKFARVCAGYFPMTKALPTPWAFALTWIKRLTRTVFVDFGRVSGACSHVPYLCFSMGWRFKTLGSGGCRWKSNRLTF